VKIRFTPGALRQLDQILQYVAERNPQAANRVKERIQEIVTLLASHPMAGESTDQPGRRRMIANPYPYVIFYRIRGDELIIQRIRHTSQRPL
jgi:toxin ParE1/3/4